MNFEFAPSLCPYSYKIACSEPAGGPANAECSTVYEQFSVARPWGGKHGEGGGGAGEWDCR